MIEKHRFVLFDDPRVGDDTAQPAMLCTQSADGIITLDPAFAASHRGIISPHHTLVDPRKMTPLSIPLGPESGSHSRVLWRRP